MSEINNDSNIDNGSFSSPKRRLLEAQKKDKQIEKQVIVEESQRVAKKISENFWDNTLQEVIENTSKSMKYKNSTNR